MLGRRRGAGTTRELISGAQERKGKQFVVCIDCTCRGKTRGSFKNYKPSSSSESSSDHEEEGYSTVSLQVLRDTAPQWLPFLGKSFLDTDEHVVFRVHSVCTHPDYDGLMFKYFVVTDAAETLPPVDGRCHVCPVTAHYRCLLTSRQ